MKLPTSALVRAVDPRVATIRVALAGALLGGVTGGAWHRWHLGASWGGAASNGVGIGVMTFLAWACARELDPDRQWTAFLALPIGAALSLTGAVHDSAGVLALLAVRLAAGTTGRPLTGIDAAAATVLAAWASVGSRGGVVASLALAVAIAWALRVGRVRGVRHVHPTGAQGATGATGATGARHARLFVRAALVTVPAATVVAALLADRLQPRWPSPHGLHLALELATLVVAALVAALPVPPVTSPGDAHGHAIVTSHVRAARVLAGALVVAALALGGVQQVAALACLVAAAGAAIVATVVVMLATRRRAA